MPIALVGRIAQKYGLHIRSDSSIAPSDEAVGWRAEAERPLFIHQSPPWRTAEELTWIHTLVSQVARTFPLAIAPLATTSGATFLEHGGSFITVYPFVEGTHLDREDAVHREAAARRLAELHRVLRACEMPPRPQPGPRSPWGALGQQPMPPELEDRELDAWHAALLQRTDLVRGPIHGDYYRRNMLWSDARVVAVVDWHEARHDVLVAEVASAAWEFSKDAMSRSFSRERARAFLDAYADAGGPADMRDRSLMIPLIRWRLRVESLLESRGALADGSYREAMAASFNALRSVSL